VVAVEGGRRVDEGFRVEMLTAPPVDTVVLMLVVFAGISS